MNLLLLDFLNDSIHIFTQPINSWPRSLWHFGDHMLRSSASRDELEATNTIFEVDKSN